MYFKLVSKIDTPKRSESFAQIKQILFSRFLLPCKHKKEFSSNVSLKKQFIWQVYAVGKFPIWDLTPAPEAYG